MLSRQWIGAGILAIGAILGVAIAGLPSRHHDPPLRMSAVETSTASSITIATIATTPTTEPTTTTVRPLFPVKTAAAKTTPKTTPKSTTTKAPTTTVFVKTTTTKHG